MSYRIAFLAACFSAVLALPAAACDQHEKKEKLPASTGRIYFQPTAPESAKEGEIWIDARSGRQLVLSDGEWIFRDISTGPEKALS